MRKLLVILGICLVTVFSFTSISEAEWESAGEDPKLGTMLYDTDSIETGRDPGSVNYNQAVKRPDGKGLMIQSVMIDAKRMYATIFWVTLTDLEGKVESSQGYTFPMPIAGMSPTQRNLVSKVLQIYDSKKK